MNDVWDVRKAFEDSLRWIDEFIEGVRAERDRVKAEFESTFQLILLFDLLRLRRSIAWA